MTGNRDDPKVPTLTHLPVQLFNYLEREARATNVTMPECLRRILRERYDENWMDPLLLAPGDMTLPEWCDVLMVQPRAVMEVVTKYNLKLKER
jgi:hypothetical protein